jgi:hypothetical protein
MRLDIARPNAAKSFVEWRSVQQLGLDLRWPEIVQHSTGPKTLYGALQVEPHLTWSFAAYRRSNWGEDHHRLEPTTDGMRCSANDQLTKSPSRSRRTVQLIFGTTRLLLVGRGQFLGRLAQAVLPRFAFCQWTAKA